MIQPHEDSYAKPRRYWGRCERAERGIVWESMASDEGKKPQAKSIGIGDWHLMEETSCHSFSKETDQGH